jgi:cytochrome b subunit of formate dehydrogenase
MTDSSNTSPSQNYVRFDPLQRLQHIVFLISFTTLALTGLPQKFPLATASIGIFNLFGGVEPIRQIHHASAIVMIVVSLVHILDVLYRLLVLRTKISMIPWINDLIHVYDDVMYYIGRRKHKAYYGRYSYAEKAEYLALIWGTVAMAVTGFIMWNPITTVQFLPGEAVPAAKAAHGGEAILAVLAIILWHFYHVHIKHFNKSMFTGKISREEMEHEHPAELAAIDAGAHVAPPIAPEVLRKRQIIYLPFAIIITAFFGLSLYFLAGYENTSITTVLAGEDATVYVPVTPTPRPIPTSAPEISGLLTWDGLIGPLFLQKCGTCHGESALGGLNLSTYANTLIGSTKGKVIVPGDADASKLVQVQSAGGHLGQLSEDDLAKVIEWINSNAPEK